jgi:hypothetical protein
LSWKNHLCKEAKSDLDGKPPYFRSFVQTFFLGNKTCYFPIHTPISSAPLSNDFALFKKQFPDSEGAVEEVVNLENYRQLHQFLDKEGWVAHVAGFNILELQSLVTLPKTDDPLGEIAPNLCTLLSNIQAIIAGSMFHVRRLLGRRPS